MDNTGRYDIQIKNIKIEMVQFEFRAFLMREFHESGWMSRFGYFQNVRIPFNDNNRSDSGYKSSISTSNRRNKGFLCN